MIFHFIIFVLLIYWSCSTINNLHNLSWVIVAVFTALEIIATILPYPIPYRALLWTVSRILPKLRIGLHWSWLHKQIFIWIFKSDALFFLLIHSVKFSLGTGQYNWLAFWESRTELWIFSITHLRLRILRERNILHWLMIGSRDVNWLSLLNFIWV